MDNNDDCEACWICLEGMEGPETKPGPLHANRLMQPCRCPRVVHSVCLAKWQLSQSGKSEEKFCRFCKERLPDWQENLALPGMAAVEPVMSVHFNGQTHMVKVKPGEEGRVAFIQDVRRLLRLRDNQEFSITFECKVPGHGMFLDLKGLSSYDAAVFCAAMTAVERQRLAAQKAQKAAAAAASGGSAHPESCLAPAAPGRTATTTTTTTTTAAAGGGSGLGSRPATASPAPAAAAAEAPRPSNAESDSAASDAGSHQLSSRIGSSSSASSTEAATGRRHPIDTLFNLASHMAAPGAGPAAAAAPPSGPAAIPTAAAPREAVPSTGAGGSMAGQPHAAAAHHPSGGPQASQLQQQHGAAAHGSAAAAAPAACAYDSACEVEPAGAARTGNSGAVVEGSSSVSAAGSGDDRHKLQRHGRTGLGLGSSLAAAAQRSRREGGGTWLSRLLLCASFRSAQEAAR